MPVRAYLWYLATFTVCIGFSLPQIKNIHEDENLEIGNSDVDPTVLVSMPGSNQLNNFTFNTYWGLACKCSNIGIDLELSKWGILANNDTSKERGNVFNAFHANDFKYPMIDEKTGVFLNGGIPQAMKLSKRLEAATVDIIKKISNPKFNGLAIIDWEKWFPIFDQKKDLVYKKASVELLKQRMPNWNNETVEMVAEVEFANAAQALMQGVLQLGKKLRPNATWGFYHYPYCENVATINYTCSNDTTADNDKLTWLFDESNALFPSIYLRPYIKDNRKFVDARLRETLRILGSVKEPGKPVYVYNRFNYSHSSLYYNIGDIKMSVGKAASLSFDGIVLWGDVKQLNNQASCTELKDLLETTYGPVLLNTKFQAESCSREMCSSHGRCLLDDTELSTTTSDDIFWKWQNLTFVKCRCLPGWTAKNCSQTSNTH